MVRRGYVYEEDSVIFIRLDCTLLHIEEQRSVRLVRLGNLNFEPNSVI